MLKHRVFSVAAIAMAVVGSVVADPISDAAPQAMSLLGNTDFDGWNALTAANNPGFPSFPGTGAWPSPIGSNVAGSGDAALNKIANGAGGGIYPAGGALYYGGFSSTPNTNGGTLSAFDTTPIANLKTIVFQLEIAEAWTYDLWNDAAPVLKVNGSSFGPASYTDTLVQAFNGTVTMPTGEEPIYINLHALQWDLSSFVGPINSFSIEWNGVQHAQVYALQIDQSDTALGAAAWAAAPVPEPGTMAVLGLGAMALIRRRRKA